MTIIEEAEKTRKPDYNITPLLANRWSPRAMSGEEISDDDLNALFEAARWAPSSFNDQPWRFIYAKRGTEHWDTIFNLLMEANQTWCKDAAALVVILSHKNFEKNDKPNNTHSFSAGSAFQNLSLEGAARNLVVHGMAGFDYEKARADLGVPDNYNVEAMAAIGKPGKKEDLPEALAEREVVTDRKPLKDIVFEGKFG